MTFLPAPGPVPVLSDDAAAWLVLWALVNMPEEPKP